MSDLVEVIKESNMDERQPTRKQRWGWGVFIPLALIIIIGLWLPARLGSTNPGGGMALSWLVNALLMFAIIALIGLALDKGPFGILIDHRNMMSLSRLQMVLWTVMILSAFITTALARVADTRVHPDGYQCGLIINDDGNEVPDPNCAGPLDITLPPLLWTLMGISLTSAISSPLLKAFKAQRTSEDDRRRKNAAARTSMTLGGADVEPATYENVLKEKQAEMPEEKPLTNEGALVKKTNWMDARLSDIYMGEEVANFMYVDIAKVQNFLFSVFSVVAYAVALGFAMSGAQNMAGFFAFPEVPEGLVAIIGISHGGYLTDKAFTHAAPTEEPPG